MVSPALQRHEVSLTQLEAINAEPFLMRRFLGRESFSQTLDSLIGEVGPPPRAAWQPHVSHAPYNRPRCPGRSRWEYR